MDAAKTLRSRPGIGFGSMGEALLAVGVCAPARATSLSAGVVCGCSVPGGSVDVTKTLRRRPETGTDAGTDSVLADIVLAVTGFGLTGTGLEVASVVLAEGGFRLVGFMLADLLLADVVLADVVPDVFFLAGFALADFVPTGFLLTGFGSVGADFMLARVLLAEIVLAGADFVLDGVMLTVFLLAGGGLGLTTQVTVAPPKLASPDVTKTLRRRPRTGATCMLVDVGLTGEAVSPDVAKTLRRRPGTGFGLTGEAPRSVDVSEGAAGIYMVPASVS